MFNVQKVPFDNISMNFLGIYQVLFTIIIILFTWACTEAHMEETYPFLVKIDAKGKFLVCAGTILTPCIVLTSAQCVDGVKLDDVVVTHVSNRATRYVVASLVVHPLYNSMNLANDIAVIRITRMFEEPWSAITLNNMPKEKIFPKCHFIQMLGWPGHLMNNPVKNDTNSILSEKPICADVRLMSSENCSSLKKSVGGIFHGEKLCGETEEVGYFIGPGGPLLCSLHSRTTQETTPKKNWLSQQTKQIDQKETLADPIDLLDDMRNAEEKKVKREVEDDGKYLQLGIVSWGKGCCKIPSLYIRTDYYYEWIIKTSRDLTDGCDVCGMFTFVSPLDTNGATVTVSNAVILSVSTAILLRLLL